MGTPRLVLLACAATIAVSQSASAQLTAETTLFSPTPALDDRFGQGVALDGDTLAVGVIMSGPLISYGPGRVEVFRGAGPGWALEAVLTPPNGQLADHFGRKVALDGDTLLVGAPYADDQAPTSGAAYVYRRTAGVWALEQQLFPTGIGPGATLGSGVAVEGDRLVVGASGGRGRAYLFERSGGTWTQTQPLDPGPLGDPDHFGTAVDIDGDRILVTAPQHDAGGHNAGALFLFELQAGVWSMTDRLDGPPESDMGSAAALEGDDIATPAYWSSGGGLYVWERQPGGWVRQGPLPGTLGARLTSVDLEGGRIVTAGIGDRAYVFERGARGWTDTVRLVGLSGIGIHLSKWIGLDGDQVAIGARDLAIAGPGAGGVYVFHLSGRDVELVCDSLPNSTGQVATLGLEGTLAVGANDTGLHVLGAVPNSVALMTYGANEARYPFAGGVLCIDPFGGVHRLAPLPLDGIGHARMPLDLTLLTGAGAISPGEAWIFQAWYRDPAAGGAQFNLTGALRLGFTP